MVRFRLEREGLSREASVSRFGSVRFGSVQTEPLPIARLYLEIEENSVASFIYFLLPLFFFFPCSALLWSKGETDRWPPSIPTMAWWFCLQSFFRVFLNSRRSFPPLPWRKKKQTSEPWISLSMDLLLPLQLPGSSLLCIFCLSSSFSFSLCAFSLSRAVVFLFRFPHLFSSSRSEN